MTAHIVCLPVADGWAARERRYPGWVCRADTYEELKQKAPRSFKSHVSRNMRFEWFVHGSAVSEEYL